MKRMYAKVVILIAIFLCATVAWCEEPATEPSTQPTTSAATTGPGPKEALKAFFDAIAQGDPAGIATACVADDPDSKSLVLDFADMANAMAALRKQVGAKFGEDQLDTITGILPSEDDVDAMNQEIDGDSALVGDAAGGLPVKLVFRNGDWRVDIGSLRQSTLLSDDPHAFVIGLIKAIGLTMADLTAGKLGNVDAVSEALAARELTVVDKATSRPTTTTAP